MSCSSISPRPSLSPRILTPCLPISPRVTRRPRSSVRHIYGSLQKESIVRKRHVTPPGSAWGSTLTLDLGALEPGAYSLPTLSRPPTSRCCTPSSRVTTPRSLIINIDDGIDDDCWNCVRVRSMSPDATGRGAPSPVGSLARQCCDVLGPRVCHECSKIRARKTRGNRDTLLTSRLRMPERNLAVALLVAKAMPALPVDQIHMELNNNKIVRPCFKTALSRRRQYEQERQQRERVAHESWKRHAVPKAFAAEVRPPTKQDGVLKLAVKSIAEPMYPTFVSPRKAKKKDSYFVSYYEPPIITKACQNVEPAFYAGTDASYELPERLPDEMYAED